MGKSKKRRKNSSSDSSDFDSDDSIERERKKDLKERDEFSNRLKSRDKERTRNIARPTVVSGRPENEKDIQRLRIESRRKYLAKRKDDKIAELEADIIDDEYLFQDEILTEREKYEREHKKRLLNLAKEHEKARELEMVRRYHMPQDCKANEMEVDLENEKEMAEGKKWEQEQMSSAVFHFGSKDRPSAQEEYDLLVDQIEFIQTLNMPGTRMDKNKEDDEMKKKILGIEETRRSLPIFPYKEDLIAAVKQYQVNMRRYFMGSGMSLNGVFLNQAVIS